MWIVLIEWKNSVHSYLFLACISSFVSNMGYLFEMKATTEEAYLTALKLSYAGRVWITFALFLFAAKMCRVRLPKWLIGVLTVIHTGIYAAVLTIGSNTLYYPTYQFVSDPIFPRFYHDNGIVHDLLMSFNIVFAVLAMWWLVAEYRRERAKKAQYRFLMLIMSFGVQMIAFLLQITGVFGISMYYDLTMPATLFGTIFLLTGIFGFDLLGTTEIARDFVTDRISEGIIAVDNAGRIQYYNEPVTKLYPEFEFFFGSNAVAEKISHVRAKKGSALGEHVRTVRTPYDIIASIQDAVSKDETIKINDRVYTPEENDLTFMGESYGKLYALVDDTEHYRYMEELQEQRDIANHANEAKSLFLASMSHEIRTPINAVLGMDEMILRESNEHSIRTYAADIMSAGKTLLSLINDILDLSKVEEGKMDIIPVQYELSSLINDLVNMIRDRADKKNLKFTVTADSHSPYLLIGDEIRVRQCVMNLLTNAVKYTETGEVKLTVSYEKTDEKHINLGFKVEDTGIGMKEEDMENLFSPYKRIEEKRNRAIEGTGLGMSITRQLLDLMGSELKVKSEYGRGSEFSFAVLQEVVKWDEIGDITARLNERSADVHEYHELFHAPNAKILVVDDTEMNLTVIKSLLKKTLIAIDTASSGKDAVKMAADTRYDLMFIDHMMPDMDGIDTLKAVREAGMSKDTPAVALTANAVSGARDMYLEAGFTDYLSKPVDGEKLEKLLANMLPDDKIEAAGEEETQEAEMPDTALECLKGIDEIDEDEGLKNCGSGEGYMSVLSVFRQTAGPKADEIEALWKDGDTENYTIKVHALKSSARIIGAAELSGLAKDLEDAGKRKDTAFIDSNTGRLLSMYRTLEDKLSTLDKGEEDLKPISEGALKEAYQTMVEIAGSMDYALMDGILSDLKGYSLSDADRSRVSTIERALTELDWEAIIKEAKEAL